MNGGPINYSHPDGGDEPRGDDKSPGQNWRHPGDSPSHLGRVSERRQLWARDTRLGTDAPFVYIEEGQADALRADCKAGHLICPVPGCADPRYTTKGGSKRDHFAHLVAQEDGHHTPESRHHFMGKELIGQWLRGTYPEALVHVDEEPIDNGQRPDVLARFPDGRAFAFEVQYSAITEAEWRRRHAGYAAEGITDIWLFGHIPPHLRPAGGEYSCPRYMLSTLAESLGRIGYTARWIDPDGRSILSRAIESERRTLHPEGGRPRICLSVDQFPSCRIEGREFRTPTDDRAERLKREAEQRAEQERAAREKEERDRREQELRRERTKARLKAEELARWKQVEISLAKRYGTVPPIIAESVKAEGALFGYHPCHWRTLIFVCLINGNVGGVFTYNDALKLFITHPSFNKPAGQKAITAFLFRLKQKGYVSFQNDTYWIGGDIRILSDLATAPKPPERLA